MICVRNIREKLESHRKFVTNPNRGLHMVDDGAEIPSYRFSGWYAITTGLIIKSTKDETSVYYAVGKILLRFAFKRS